MHDAQRQCTLGIDSAAGQAELECRAASGQSRQSLRTAEPGDDAQVDLRLSPLRMRAGKPQVTCHGQFHAAAQREPVDRRNHRLAKALDTRHQRLAITRKLQRLHRRESGEFRDVGARDESLAAGAGEDDHSRGLIGPCILEGRV